MAVIEMIARKDYRVTLIKLEMVLVTANNEKKKRSEERNLL